MRIARTDNPFSAIAAEIRQKPVAFALSVLLGHVPLGALLVLPIVLAIGSAFVHEGRLSLYWFGRVVGNEMLVGQLVNGVVLATVTTGVCLLLAVPLAVLRARCRFRGQGVLGVAVLVPLILPPFVGALAIKRLLGQFGVLNLLLAKAGLLEIEPGSVPPDWLATGFAGVVILQALHLFPILYLNASAALANVDCAYAQAARNLGAGPWRAFFGITLPLMRPGLFAGATIVFIWSLTDIGTPLILNYHQLIPVTIFRELGGGEYTGRTFSLVFIMLAASVALYVLGKFIFGRAPAAESGKATVQAEMRQLGPAATAGAWALFGGVIFLALLPHVGVALSAVSDRWLGTVVPAGLTTRHLRAVLTSEETYRSVLNSASYAGVSTVVDVVLGCAAAWMIVRAKVPGRRLLDGLAMLPLAVPGLILAAGYVAMTASGPLEAIGPNGNPFAILVIAYAVRRLPFVVRGVSAGLQQVPETLEEAARNLGASQVGAARRITLPLVAANIVAAAVLAFSFAMLEVSDSLILAQRSPDYPIAKQIYILFTAGTGEALNVAAALGVYGMVLLGGTMALAAALLGRRLGAIFRA